MNEPRPWLLYETETIAPTISTTNGADGASDAGANDGTRAAARVVNTHDFLINFLEANPCRDGDAFLAKLTGENPEVARRVMDVRTAYASQDFEWDITKGLVLQVGLV